MKKDKRRWEGRRKRCGQRAIACLHRKGSSYEKQIEVTEDEAEIKLGRSRVGVWRLVRIRIVEAK